ncbi:MAG TPA: hypothetical protein VKP65_17555 [Rhodothermales bacterium]|nr:hypothetical protein [Rhodothermales bacterium]
MPPQTAHDQPLLPMHVSSSSPAYASIKRLLALLQTLAHEFDDTEWFDERLFQQRVDPLLQEAEATLQQIRHLDPTYPWRPLRRTLHTYMRRRLHGLPSPE